VPIADCIAGCKRLWAISHSETHSAYKLTHSANG